MLILGIDPGIARVGVGLVKYENKKTTVLTYGCLTTNLRDASAHRLNNLYEQLTTFIKQYRPDAVAVENIFFFKNLKTVIGVSQARGVILLAASRQKTAIFEFTPLQIKQAITGYGRADKQQIQQMVKTVLCLKEIPRPDDAADALAAAICCAHSLAAPAGRAPIK